MAIFRSLKALRTRRDFTESSRPFLTFLCVPSTTHPQNQNPVILNPSLPPELPFCTKFLSRPFSLSATYGISLSPLSRLVVFRSHGPLFLLSPPWKLSQSATPFHLQGDAVFPRRRQALKLLQRSTARFPIKVGLVKVPDLVRVSRKRLEKPVSLVGDNVRSGLVHSLFNLPNFVSFGRMVSGPVLGWMIINEMYIPAFAGLAISGASDWLDGYIARRMGINSVVGSYLDPLADKVLIVSVAVAMVQNNLLHPGLVGLVVLRDVALVGGAVYNRASSLGWEWKSWSDFVNLDGTLPERIEPLFISKVNTVFQLILVATALLQPELGSPETQTYITWLSWLVASTTVGSTAAYGAQYMRNRAMRMIKSH